MASIAYRYPTTLNNGDTVKVYKNLHNEKYSIVPMSGPYKGKVVGHASHVVLANATTKVNEAGRQRVIREKKKYVHAYIVGQIILNRFWSVPVDQMNPISYNPYKASQFYWALTGDTFTASRLVNLSSNGAKAFI